MERNKVIYLDYNATTPISATVAKAMQPYFTEHFGNPSSSHIYGSVTRTAVEKARRQLASLLGCHAHEIIFTSGGTESNNLAIQGVAFAQQKHGRHIITSGIEHPAVAEVCNYLESLGFIITRINPDAYGLIDAESVIQAIRHDTILISIMHANNEVGTIQPISEISEVAREKGIVMHSDCAQSIGKIPVRVDDLGVDLLSVAAHKFYGPKGVGALYIREGTPLKKIYHGADHEMNTRPGTENVLEIVGLGQAAEEAEKNMAANTEAMMQARDHLESKLQDAMPQMRVNGHPDLRLPNTLSVSFQNLEASTLLLAMDTVAASAGAACHTDGVTVSATLEAMGVPVDWAMGTIRFSTGRYTSIDEVNRAADEIIKKVKQFLPDEEAQPTTFSTVESVKLTQFTHGLGCACKLRPQDLEAVLKKMPIAKGPNILLGAETADDAAVYRLNDELALVQTVDFFTPVVDDPYLFGAIAATNALSDIYAMGAQAIFALNIVGFPAKRLPMSVLEEILKGASDKVKEAGIPTLGGHTVEDNEPKFGLVVSGLIHPDKLWRNDGAQQDDVLILTKPIGLGIMTTALKRGLLDVQQIEEISNLMSELNKRAAEAMKNNTVNACTDITGFGLLGHLKEMMLASRVSAELWVDQIPVILGAENFISAGIVPGGTKNNLAFVAEEVEFSPRISEMKKLLLADAQTSGGLLFSVPAGQSKQAIERLNEQNVRTSVIGAVKSQKNKSIYVKQSNK
ncbi:MAG: selenide, water dikinase SelD [Bacteroidales bacterium]|nr:selenide, water dikinase SelD [Bacteroidales bacterium]